MNTDSTNAEPEAGLTPRQQEIRTLLRRGMSNKMIAGVLGISEGTVKNHISEIFRVLNATNRTQAAQFTAEAPHQSDSFDTQEYIHLALHASSAGNPHACMTYLKEALRQEPENATALYLLAVQHAEIGLAERAIAGMRSALGIAPALEIARFQLGLLLVNENRAAQAKEHFAALENSADAALRAYSDAMLAVCDDDLQTAREKMALGLSRSPGNAALAALMRRLLERFEKAEGAEAPVDLGAYRLTAS